MIADPHVDSWCVTAVQVYSFPLCSIRVLFISGPGAFERGCVLLKYHLPKP
jgi:hypothetical protein